MKKSITISAQKRPQHLKETLEALKQCDGFEEWAKPVVFIDHHERQQDCVEVAKSFGLGTNIFLSKIGCNSMIHACMESGFSSTGSDFHVHFEDDTVPTKGALRWFDWAMHHLKDNYKVLSVLAYQRTPCGEDDQYVLQRKDLSWGWGTWFARWRGTMARNWLHKDGDMAWDTHIQQNVLGDRYVAQPCISRIQNTGSTDGTYCLDKHTYETQHRSRKTTDSIIREFQLRASSS